MKLYGCIFFNNSTELSSYYALYLFMRFAVLTISIACSLGGDRLAATPISLPQDLYLSVGNTRILVYFCCKLRSLPWAVHVPSTIFGTHKVFAHPILVGVLCLLLYYGVFANDWGWCGWGCEDMGVLMLMFFWQGRSPFPQDGSYMIVCWHVSVHATRPL